MIQGDCKLLVFCPLLPDGMVDMILSENSKFLRFFLSFFFTQQYSNKKEKGMSVRRKKIKIENLGCTGSPDIETGSRANLVTSQS